jgi:hypothetical protein
MTLKAAYRTENEGNKQKESVFFFYMNNFSLSLQHSISIEG